MEKDRPSGSAINQLGSVLTPTQRSHFDRLAMSQLTVELDGVELDHPKADCREHPLLASNPLF